MPFLLNSARRIWLGISIGIISTLMLIWALYQTWLGMAHAVIPNQVYRSAQLSPSLLSHYIKTKNIKSVINLRGAQPRSAWYQKEVAVTTRLGATHYDISLSSHEVPIKEKLRMLVYIILHAQQPLLVHCLGGADRSGLASAIALILDQNATLAQSERQISFRHLVLSPSSIGKLVFPYYQHWLATNHLPHNRENFLKWVCSPHPFHHDAPYDYPKELDQFNPCPAQT